LMGHASMSCRNFLCGGLSPDAADFSSNSAAGSGTATFVLTAEPLPEVCPK
jgi:hypothetical protein